MANIPHQFGGNFEFQDYIFSAPMPAMFKEKKGAKPKGVAARWTSKLAFFLINILISVDILANQIYTYFVMIH